MGDPRSDFSIDMGWLSQGENSNSRSDRNLGVDELPYRSIYPWLKDLMEVEGEGGNNKSQQVTMHKVSPMLREVESNKKCFDPLVVSIGPYHHGKPELHSMEKHKAAMARQYLLEGDVSIEELYKKVVEVVVDARKCYLEGSTDGFNDEAFAKMMFLDGCFILQFINCFLLHKLRHMRMNSSDIALVQRDLLLLENQLPFLVLEALMVSEKDKWLKKIEDFIQYTGALSPDHVHKKDRWLERMTRKRINVAESYQMKEALQGPEQHVHLLGILHFKLVYPIKFVSLRSATSNWPLCRSASELNSAGIRIEPGNGRSLSNISFDSGPVFGTLKLPPIIVDDSTKFKLLNLVAYESSPGAPDGEDVVASYICFMASLIVQVQDAMVMRSHNILFNFLGQDQKVVELFDDLAKYLVPNPRVYLYLSRSMERHYRNKVKVWLSEWLFSNFSVLTFVAATLTIVLSLIQTYFAAFPRAK